MSKELQNNSKAQQSKVQLSKIQRIRNFCIIAHIDHGKTTLSDRIINICNAVTDKQMKDQFLDNLEVERQRGITVKAQTIRLLHTYNGIEYILNLIDTPGHVDFSYEVSRALSACEGAILVVDATQGVEAQTVSNAHNAINAKLKIITALNKVDLPTAQVDEVTEQVAYVLDLYDEPVLVSAKSGLGVGDLLSTLIDKVPAPTGDINAPLKALLIDGWYDPYFGVVLLVRMIDGVMKTGMQVEFMSQNANYKVDELGYISPGKIKQESLQAGEIGYLVVNVKTLADCAIGDTICEHKKEVAPLPGFKKNLPIVFCGIFPVDRDDYLLLDKSLQRLSVNDASFTFERMQSPALGLGFRCGFLGMLHMDVIVQRLEDEFGVTAVITAPSVNYRVYLKNGEMMVIHAPSQMPEMNEVDYIEEPMVQAMIFVPHEHLGKVMELCMERRGEQISSQIIQNRTLMIWKLPLREIIFDFYDSLKSLTHGYASFDYEMAEYKQSNIVPLNILLNGTAVDALATMIHKDSAERQGRQICETLKENLDRQQVAIAIQAAIGAKIIARETLSPYRKDVTAKLYGGDRTRKDKLLKKQQKGKKKMREIAAGSVNISQKALFSVLGFAQNRKES